MRNAAVSSMTFTLRRTPKEVLKFEVDKTYQYIERPLGFTTGGVQFTNDDNSFRVSRVDDEGDAWSMDCTYDGIRAHDRSDPRPWCCATQHALIAGMVVLVDG